MKKIVCLILALTCVFALFACGEDDPTTAIFEMIEASEPNGIQTQTTHTRENGVSYKGLYVTKITDGGFTFSYSYQTPATVSPDADPSSSIQTNEGEILYNGSQYSTDGGASWFTEAPDVAYMGIKLALTPENIGESELSRDGKTVIAKLSAEQITSIFGTTVSAENAELRITVDGTRLSKVSLTYTTANGTSVIVDTSYTYEPAPAADAQ